MTRKEKELKVLELLGLKVGDYVKIKKAKSVIIRDNVILKIIESYDRDEDCIKLEDCVTTDNGSKSTITLYPLIREDWEKVKAPLKDKRCRDFKDCEECPFNSFSVFNCNLADDGTTMGEIYEDIIEDINTVKEIIYGGEE